MYSKKERIESLERKLEVMISRILDLEKQIDKNVSTNKFEKLLEYFNLKEKYNTITNHNYILGTTYNYELIGYEPIKRCTKCKKQLN